MVVTTGKTLTDQELLRYSRHIMLPELDIEGQQLLKAAKVLVVGLGGLGCPVAMYLAAAGVGELLLMDFDQVELTNLQRQIAYNQTAVGKPKAEALAETLRGMNSDCVVTPVVEKASQDNLLQWITAADLVVDATDNFAVRFAINTACVQAKRPLVSGAAIGLQGQVTVFDSRQPTSPCYRCLYSPEGEDQLRCAETGVLGPLVGLVGTIQAVEAVKVIAGIGEPLLGKLLLIDGKIMEFRTIKMTADPVCPVCANSG
ncbi:HesA/MoeB/ThiF family protein [Spartinivicinus poritis]|uniref:Molybdopterin-synthase adenylyltransferase MoeB n=1 Tax=Spartinivicinus poritis TaxID=2994640 RepID=A0ABT5U9K6_9GAMM|nr:molybdopterin-synthase adenylyltransferase MoeB [Spartinivicinus sp. A2-2]MDE1463044.1 molybdopterin-synthase adenylyltransferase MoeB [Spartinivicinus sp. A2-2]